MLSYSILIKRTRTDVKNRYLIRLLSAFMNVKTRLLCNNRLCRGPIGGPDMGRIVGLGPKS